MFNNQIFDSWLNHKADEILSKVNRETISTEEMIVLILKAQTNHFYHMDLETKQDLTGLRSEIKEFKTEITQDMNNLRAEMKEFKTEITQDMNNLRTDMKEFKTEMRQDMAVFKAEIKDEFKKIDTKFMWSTGITVTMFLGLYLKLFLG